MLSRPLAVRSPRLLFLSLFLLALTLVYAGLLAVELLHQIREWPILHRDRDFPSYYLTARQLLHGRDFYQGLQEEARSLGIADYFVDYAVTPPTFAPVVAPLALLPYPLAWGVWQLLSLAALGGALALAARALHLDFPLSLWIILGCLALLFLPLSFHLLYTHTELFILFLLTAGWLALRRGWKVPAGLLLALAGALRLYPLFFLLLLLQRRSWKALLTALFGGLGLVLLAGLLAGPASYLRYLEVLRRGIAALYPLWGNASLWGAVHKVAALWPALEGLPWLRDGLAAILSLSLLGGTLALTWKDAHLPDYLDRHFGLFTAAVLLASPLSWVYYQVLLYLPFLLLLAAWRGGKLSRPIRYVVVATWALTYVPLAQAIFPMEGARTVASFLLTLPPAGVYLVLACSRVDFGPSVLEKPEGPEEDRRRGGVRCPIAGWR